MNRSGLWDDADGFFYDALRLPDGTTVPMKVHSMVGADPVAAVGDDPWLDGGAGTRAGKGLRRFPGADERLEERLEAGGFISAPGGNDTRMISVVPPVRLAGLLGEVLRRGRVPVATWPAGPVAAPPRSPVPGRCRRCPPRWTTSRASRPSGLFGGNSNWRGPVWFPVNYMVIESLRRWDDWFGPTFTVEYPTGSGRQIRLRDAAADLANRLVSIWLPDANGRRPVYGSIEKFQADPEWRDLLLFHEYFHGDTGAGIGASHQTGWTGLVAHLLCRGGVLNSIEAGPGVDMALSTARTEAG